jgi:S-adenosylmethionine hydrolase
MAIIINDRFGWKDPYVGAVKGAIHKEFVKRKHCGYLYDVSHIAEAVYIIQKSIRFFPEGTIHIIGVEWKHTPENNMLRYSFKQYYFICADNGVVVFDHE